jgi:hypothetical protein
MVLALFIRSPQRTPAATFDPRPCACSLPVQPTQQTLGPQCGKRRIIGDEADVQGVLDGTSVNDGNRGGEGWKTGNAAEAVRVAWAWCDFIVGCWEGFVGLAAARAQNGTLRLEPAGSRGGAERRGSLPHAQL